jgi:ABC-type branched-subunit amino acid transport system ATPase component
MSGVTPAPARVTPDTHPAGSPWMVASDVEQHGSRGIVFGPLSFRITEPIAVVVGARGSGSTSLLLTLAGRMRVGSGQLRVLGLDAASQAARLRRATGIAGFAGIDDLEETVTVADLVRERLSWIGRWCRRHPRPDQAAAERLLAPVLSGDLMPDLQTDVRDLREEQAFLLRAGLALLERPKALLVDDLDHVHHPSARRRVLDQLSALPAQGVRLVVATADPRDLDFVPHLPHQVVVLTKDNH